MKKAIILECFFGCLINGCAKDDFEEKEVIVDREIIVEEKNMTDKEIIWKKGEY